MAAFIWGTQAFMNRFANQHEHIEVKLDKNKPPTSNTAAESQSSGAH